MSQVSNVPRTRVYDAIDELRDRGLVDVQDSSPKEFWVVSPDTAGRTFEREIHQRTEILRNALDDVEPTTDNGKQQDVWTVGGERAVTARVAQLFDEAKEQLTFAAKESLLTEDVMDALRRAAGRGVTAAVGGDAEKVTDRAESAMADIETFKTAWVGEATPMGRLALVDGEQTLLSALVDEGESDPAEVAIWGAGERNSLVTVFRTIFGG